MLGKTVLARRLALKYIYKDYDFRYEHVSDIKEIEEYLYDGRKKVIIIDDFLGQNTTELKDLSDNKLYNIINYARKNDNIKLILTTRTYIYNNAKQILEKFNNLSERLNNFMVEVNKYTVFDKAKILYNHLYYNNLLWSAEYLEIIKSKYYKTIIYNQNFTPRNIELICEIIKEDKPDNIIETIEELLDNPERIWEREYSKISNSRYGKYEKILLDLICFLKYEVKEEELKEQFEKVVYDDKEIDEYVFYKSIEELSNAFITISFNKKNEKIYTLANPSIGDFLRTRSKKTKNTIKKYISQIDQIDALYDFYKLFREDGEIQEQIRERIVQILTSNDIEGVVERKLIGEILDNNLTERQQKIVKKIVDTAYERGNRDDIEFILDIAEKDYSMNYMESYLLKKFKEIEIENKETKYRIAVNLVDTFEWNNYLWICNKILKRKNSKHLMDIKEYMIDCLISIVSEEAMDLMADEMSYIIEQYLEGKDVASICNEFTNWALDDLENIYVAFTEDQVEYILGVIRANSDAYIDEEEIKQEIKSQKDLKIEENNEEKEDMDIACLFEKNADYEENIKEYFEKNITDDNQLKMLLKEYDKWYVQIFLEDIKSLRILTKYINAGGVIEKNPVLFGEKITKYMIEDNLYAKYKEQLEDISYKLLNNENIETGIVKWSQLTDDLLNAEIFKKENGKIQFINDFFIIYYSFNKMKDSIELSKVLEESYEWLNGTRRIEIINMYSYINIEKFNIEYLIPELYYYIAYVRKENKYTISKSLIDKFEPTVNISRYGNKKYILSREYTGIQYIGINLCENLMNLKYTKIKKFMNEKYTKKGHKYREINFKKAVRDEETLKEFDKISCWNYMNKAYNKILDAYYKLIRNPKIDAYNLYDNQKLFNTYFDKNDDLSLDDYFDI